MRKSLQFFIEKVNHEYWPGWLLYLPSYFYLLWHAIRLRQLAFFSNVNPTIDMGGFFGEKKAEIYALLPESSYPTTILIRPGDSIQTVLAAIEQANISVPLIAKPDVGERGDGVFKVHDNEELANFVLGLSQDYLLQELVDWPKEYGLMFSRNPDTDQVTLLSITGKKLLQVTGNGQETVAQLLANTWRGQKQIERLNNYKADLLASIPEEEEIVIVEPMGNHIRGTKFYDANHLITPMLEKTVTEVIQASNGVYYGRLDVKAPSEAALMHGTFSILELNGLTAEPGHIYDPEYNIFQVWAEIHRHICHLPAISQALMKQGHAPVTALDVVTRYEEHMQIRMPVLKAIAKWFSPAAKAHKQAVPDQSQSALA